MVQTTTLGLFSVVVWSIAGGVFLVYISRAFARSASARSADLPPAPPPAASSTVQVLGQILDCLRKQTAVIDQPPASDPQLVEVIASLRQIHESARGDAREATRALDTIAFKMDEFVRAHRHMLEVMFGSGISQGALGAGQGPILASDDEPDLRRTAERFMSTYGISWDEALKRAQAYRLYKPNDSPMRAEA